MNTIVYVDGYNFYYGCLKGSPYKWLDIVRLFNEHILPSSAFGVDSRLLKLNFFTADICRLGAHTHSGGRTRRLPIPGLHPGQAQRCQEAGVMVTGSSGLQQARKLQLQAW